jgi:hypothetical protein
MQQLIQIHTRRRTSVERRHTAEAFAEDFHELTDDSDRAVPSLVDEP